MNPRSCYAEGKRAAEALLVASGLGEQVRIARLFNVYGPGMADGRVVPSFIRAALQGDPLQIYGADTTRSFTYVSDAVNGLIALMACDDPRAHCKPVNIGSENETRLVRLARLVRILAESKSVSAVRLPREGEPHRRKANTSLARHLIQWEQKVSLNVGLAETIEAARREVRA
jgi:nucleoside-diphosphate-sugar epimerase